MTEHQEPAIGVIGGSGLYEMEGLTDLQEHKVATPFGPPSDSFLEGRLDGRRVIFLPRHGKGHRINPSEINYRANIFGMKKLGVEWLLSASAVGTMKEYIKPGDFVIIDQFIDRTRHRPDTLFGDGIVVHVMFADPVCASLCDLTAAEGKAAGITIHKGGAYLNMEGPQFSTRAESKLYRAWGVEVIGMTNLVEAKLAREAEICFTTIAMATDYDCWHEGEEDVTVEGVLKVMRENVGKAKELIRRVVPKIPIERGCPCASALAPAILSDKAKIPRERVQELWPVLGKYF